MPVTATLHNEAFAKRATPLLEAGTLTLSDLHVVDRLARRAGESRPDVLLALALAARAPRQGHTGVRLRAVVEETLVEPGAEGSAAPFRWPQDPDAWLEDVRSSPLVATTDGDDAERRPFVYQHGLLQVARIAGYEERLAGALRQRARAVDLVEVDVPRLRHDLEELFAPEGTQPGAVTPELHVTKQVLAATMTVLARTTVISGGPGTGKTTTIRKVLVALYEQARRRGLPPPRVALAAPTGKAAARMGESLAQLPDDTKRPARGISDEAWTWLTGLVPTTLHRLLGWQPRTPSRFRHDAETPLPFDVVVVDEASMIDVALMCKLVEAVAGDARLVLLGDRNQLVSVDAGSALADVTAGAGRHGIRLPTDAVERLDAVLGEGAASRHEDPSAPALAACMVHFTEAFRFETKALRTPIYALADASGEGETAVDAPHLARAVTALLHCTTRDRRAARDDRPVPEGTDVRHVPHESNGRHLADSVLKDIVATYAWTVRPLRADTGETARQTVLRRVDALRVLAAHRSGTLGVDGLNRTITAKLVDHLQVPSSQWGTPWWTGRMVLVTENDYEHDLWNGDIGVVVRTAERTEVVFPGRDRGAPTRAVAAASMPAHETAFAMTIHKSQGSQFDHAVVVLPEAMSRILTRELVYTGISRAKERLTLCGDEHVLRQSLVARVHRATSLEARLWR
jgi:exodeoxyribonuclease V alpha subunit